MTFTITVLGSSSALPTSKRYPTAHALNVHERFFLIDCGEGTQIQMRRFKINFGKINHIFITHLHGDHYFGLFGLLSSFSLLGRKNDLHIYAPVGIEKLINNQFSDTGYELSFNVVYHLLKSKETEIIYEDNNITVQTIPMKHRTPTFGFLLKEKKRLRNIIKEKIAEYNIPIRDILRIKEGEDFIDIDGEIIPNKELTIDPPIQRSYAHCSDTAYNEDMIPLIEGADLLYHESTFAENMKDRAEQTWHSTAAQAATIASKAGVEKLLIGHFSARYRDNSEFLKEAEEIFSNIIAAEDGMVIHIDAKKRC